ncbi:Protein of unknown function [Allopseudospirillum japonicum]|uniref:DUF3095 domain-containing protein n=1 Tax=Allopseudospirillum japonicum TaxID=64971 RepID=A0A1H6Q418_9GAMM|nr:DUF3095 family protein [Allopseudospirillum japonicum]SEI38589.1 Protein of unknown function [Allopseudospirillum japonicum]
MSTAHFYQDLAGVPNFETLLQLDAYQVLPDDWYLLIADIENSTDKIHAGAYQEVNTLGASCIISVLNVCRPLKIPYSFGGDGAVLAIPAAYYQASVQALQGTQTLAQHVYQLKLRIGAVTVKALNQHQAKVKVAKLQTQVSGQVNEQAAFMGQGLVLAETWLKQGKIQLAHNPQAQADFSGLQCRWNQIASPSETTLALLVEARGESLKAHLQIYQEVTAKIKEIYGEAIHPLNIDNLHMTYAESKLGIERKLHQYRKSKMSNFLYAIKTRFIVALASMMMATNIKTSGYAWGNYKADMLARTDYRKLEQGLRLIVAGTYQQQAQLVDYLHQQQNLGQLFFGIHSAQAALLTCMIFDPAKDHFHFVDAADGGYALAAKQLKQAKQAALV